MGSNAPGPFGDIPSPSTLLSNLGSLVPGESFVLDLVKAATDLPAILSDVLKAAEAQNPVDIIKGMVGLYHQGVELVGHDLAKPWEIITKFTVGELFSDLLRIGLEVDPSEFDDDAQKGVQTVDTMLGFAFLLPYILTAVEHMGTALLGGRWAKVLHKAIGELPEELGMTFFMGETIIDAFKTAVGASIEEGINLQKRGARLAWPQYKQLMKQHVFDSYQVGAGGKIERSSGPPSNANAKAVMTRLLATSGFTDETIDWLINLSDVSVPVGDIAQLYQREIIDHDKVKELLDKAGYTDQEVSWLIEMYVDKAETSAGSQLRSTARQLFTNQLIGEDQYRTILTDTNAPARQIEDDIRAVNMVHDVGRTQQSVALVKSRYLHKLIPAETAIADLRTLNYSLQYASELVQSWDLPPIHPKHGLNQSKLLSYFISGLLSEAQVRDGLAALSVDQKTIDFLVAHPSAANGARVLRLGPNMVLQAYVEGAVTDQQLPDMFKKVGVQPDDVALWIDKAVYRKSHTKGTTTYTTHLSAGEIIACFKFGIFDENTAHERLMQLGYSPDDATLKLEIENKGVFQPPVPPVFATLGDAIAYLKAAGYHVLSPTDPKILAAEAMLAQAGYSWTMPSTTLPGDTLGGGGSGGLVDPGGGFTVPPITGTPPPGPVQPPI